MLKFLIFNILLFQCIYWTTTGGRTCKLCENKKKEEKILILPPFLVLFIFPLLLSFQHQPHKRGLRRYFSQTSLHIM